MLKGLQMLWIVGHDFSLSDRIFADILKRESHPPNSKPLKHRGKEATRGIQKLSGVFAWSGE
jgi:hypothetical protein